MSSRVGRSGRRPTSSALRRREGPRRFPDPVARSVHGKPLVYLDNAATSQKPRAVHRRDRPTTIATPTPTSIAATHLLSERATGAYERRARQGGRGSSTPPSARDHLLTTGTTEGINLVAQSWGRADAERRRRDPDVAGSSTTRTSCRGSCSASRRARRCGRADRRPRRARSRRVRRAAVAAHEASSRSATSRTRSARSTRCADIDRAGARAPAPWCWSTARRRCRTWPSTCRRSTATSTRSRATRCSGRPASACSTAQAALLEAMPP